MKKALFFLLSLTGLFVSCKHHGIETPDPHVLSNPIRPQALAIGQNARYVLFSGEDYYLPGNYGATYLPDTLLLTVVDQDQNGFLMEEKLSPGSASRNGAEHVRDADSTFFYYWLLKDDSLFMKPRAGALWINSHFTHNDFALPLQPVMQPVVQIIGWKTDHAYCECYWTATDPKYTFEGVTYEDLNILTDNRGMQVDGPGSWYAYSARYGIVKTASYSWWTQTGFGWELLPAD